MSFEAEINLGLYDEAPDSPHQVLNGTFETGDLTGWTLSGDIGVVSSDARWWGAYPYNDSTPYLLETDENTITVFGTGYSISVNHIYVMN